MPGTLTPTTARTALALEAAISGEYNVRFHGGAVGDGLADDTQAIDTTNAVMTAAGGGRLLFPRGKYKTSGGHVISVPCTIAGQGSGYYHDDGGNGYHYLNKAVSLILSTSATAFTFTFTTPFVEVEYLVHHCVSATTPTAGGAFHCAGDGTGVAKASCYQFRNVVILDGYYGIEHAVGAYSNFLNIKFTGQRKYGLWLRDDANADWGDFCITSCKFTDHTNHATEAAIRYESGGGLNLVGSKFVGPNMGHGLWGHFSTASNTGQLYVTSCSFDGVGGNGIRLETAGPGKFDRVFVSNCFIKSAGLTSEPVYLNNGGASGSLADISIDHCQLLNYQAAGLPCVTVTGNGGVNVVLGFVQWGGVATRLYTKGAGDSVAGGFYSTADGTVILESALVSTGDNAGLAFAGRDGGAGYVWICDSAAGGARLHDSTLGTDVLTVDGGKNVAVSGTLTAPILDLGPAYGGTPGATANLKLWVYNDGSSKYGLGITPNVLEAQVPASSDFAVYVGGSLKFKTGASGTGFNGSTPIAKPTITGSRGGNAALASLLTQLAAYGLITDGTTA